MLQYCHLVFAQHGSLSASSPWHGSSFKQELVKPYPRLCQTTLQCISTVRVGKPRSPTHCFLPAVFITASQYCTCRPPLFDGCRTISLRLLLCPSRRPLPPPMRCRMESMKRLPLARCRTSSSCLECSIRQPLQQHETLAAICRASKNLPWSSSIASRPCIQHW